MTTTRADPLQDAAVDSSNAADKKADTLQDAVVDSSNAATTTTERKAKLQSSISAIVKFIREKKRAPQQSEEASRSAVLFRLFMITIWGINTLLPYNCLTLSNAYFLDTLFVSPSNINDTPILGCPRNENKFLYSIFPLILTWTLELVVFIVHLIIFVYSVAITNAEAETGHERKNPRQVVVAIIGSICGFIGMIFLGYYIHRLSPCSFVWKVIEIFFLTVFFAVLSGILQLYGSAFGACLGGRSLNAFTIGLDFSGVLTSLTTVLFAVVKGRVNPKAVVMPIIYLSMGCYLLLTICGLCFYRSKDYARMVVKKRVMKPTLTLKGRKGPYSLLLDAIAGNGFFGLQFLVFVQTFSLFPVTLIHVQPQDFKPVILWYPLSIVFNFSIIAFIISFTSHWIFKCLQCLINYCCFSVKNGRIYLCLFYVLAICRFPLVILLLMNSNFKPPAIRASQRFFLLNDVEFIVLVSLFALSHSLLISLCDICIGRRSKLTVKAQELGFGLSFVKLLGIVCGLAISFLFVSMY